MYKYYRLRKKLGMFLFYCLFIPLLVVLYILKQIVSIFGLPMMLFHAFRIMQTLIRSVDSWKTIAELSEDSNAPIGATRDFVLMIRESYLHFRLRVSLLPEDMGEEAKNLLFMYPPTKETWKFYEFRFKAPFGGREAHKVPDAAMVPT